MIYMIYGLLFMNAVQLFIGAWLLEQLKEVENVERN